MSLQEKDVGSHCDRQSEAQERVQIFLGGSCNPTTWRQNIAIPYLESNGISYYNPQVDNWTPDVVNIERHAKQSADCLLFVIDKQTRSTVSLVESAFMAGFGRRLVLVIYPFDISQLSIKSDSSQTSNVVETCEKSTSTMSISRGVLNLPQSTSASGVSKISSSTTSSSTSISGTIKVNGELVSLAEFQELRQARNILQSLVSNIGIPIFADIPQALSYISYLLSNDQPDRLITTREQREQSICQPPIVFSSAKDALSSQPPKTIDTGCGAFSCRESSKDLEHSRQDKRTNDVVHWDVYLSIDENGGSSVEIIPILHEKGLTYKCKSVNDLARNNSQTPVTTAATTAKLTDPDAYGSINLDELSSRTKLEESEHRTIQYSRLILEDEIKSIQNSRVILFVITNKCRGLSIMVLASYLMALFRNNLILCIQHLEEPCCIDGETLTKSAINDYNRGRVYLGDYAREYQVPVFETIREAVDCCSQRCRYSSLNNQSEVVASE